MAAEVYETVDITPFIHPFSCVIAGPSSCGKTTFLVNMLINANLVINKPIQRLVYCYGVYLKDTFKVLKQHYSFIELISGIDDSLSFDSEVNNFLILDDVMNDAVKSSTVSDYFTKGSHHKNLSVLLLTQNLFQQGAFGRAINLNTNYNVLHKNSRDITQIGNYIQIMSH